jgi:hypothetical protein
MLGTLAALWAILSDAPDSDASLTALSGAIEAAANELPAASAADQISFLTAREDSENRTFALRLISYIYASGLGVLAVIVLFEAWFGDRSKAMEYASEALKVLILPILTLVLGHYIGRHSR